MTKNKKINLIGVCILVVILTISFVIVFIFTNKSSQFIKLDKFTSDTQKKPVQLQKNVSKTSIVNDNYLENIGNDELIKDGISQYFNSKISNFTINEVAILPVVEIGAKPVDNMLPMCFKISSANNTGKSRFDPTVDGLLYSNIHFNEEIKSINECYDQLYSAFPQITIEKAPTDNLDFTINEYDYVVHNFTIINSSLQIFQEDISPLVTSDDYTIEVLNSGCIDPINNKYIVQVKFQANEDSENIQGNCVIPINVETMHGAVAPTIDISSIAPSSVPPISVELLVGDSTNVSVNDTNKIKSNSVLNSILVGKFREDNRYVTSNNFEIDTSNVPTGNYSSSYTITTSIKVIAKSSQNNLTGELNLTITFTVYEAPINFVYEAMYWIDFNLGAGETFNFHGHASCIVKLTGIKMSLVWNVPKNLIASTNNTSLWDLFYTNKKTNYINDWVAHWEQGSYIYTDVDGTAESVGMKDETNPLGNVSAFPPVAPYKNGKFYMYGHRRNGKPIEENAAIQTSTGMSNPTSNMPDIWVVDRSGASGSYMNNPLYFWKSFKIVHDGNNNLRIEPSSSNSYRFYVSDTGRWKDIGITNITNVVTKNVYTGQ